MGVCRRFGEAPGGACSTSPIDRSELRPRGAHASGRDTGPPPWKPRVWQTSASGEQRDCGDADAAGARGARARAAAADERRDRRTALRLRADGRDARLVAAAQAGRDQPAGARGHGAARRDARRAAPRRLAAAPGRLPALRTELVGRADLVDVVSAELHQTRLVTLVGPGGVGKTSVALAVGHRDARTLVRARSVRRPRRRPHRRRRAQRPAADALGVDGDASRSSTELGRPPRRSFAADRVRQLRARDRPGRRAGRRRARAGRPLPRAGDEPGTARARRRAPRARRTAGRRAPPSCSSNAPAGSNRARRGMPADPRIVELCARLDGLPLAVELAAGQVRRWSLPELRRRLDDPTRPLVARPHRHQPRHRTMGAGHRLEL